MLGFRGIERGEEPTLGRHDIDPIACLQRLVGPARKLSAADLLDRDPNLAVVDARADRIRAAQLFTVERCAQSNVLSLHKSILGRELGRKVELRTNANALGRLSQAEPQRRDYVAERAVIPRSRRGITSRSSDRRVADTASRPARVSGARRGFPLCRAIRKRFGAGICNVAMSSTGRIDRQPSAFEAPTMPGRRRHRRSPTR